jgi:adenylate cyclase
MATEIERKFLVAGDGWKTAVTHSLDIRQAYLSVTDTNTVRVRLRGGAAFLTIKSAGAGPTRQEFEIAIPFADAEAMLALRTGRIIEKRRHIVPAGLLRWEIDVFAGDLAGLVIAEIELPTETANFERPDWLGAEVTGDPRYGNSWLATAGLPGTGR